MEPAVDRTARSWRRAAVAIATSAWRSRWSPALACWSRDPATASAGGRSATGFALLRYAAYGGIAAAAVSAVALMLARLARAAARHVPGACGPGDRPDRGRRAGRATCTRRARCRRSTTSRPTPRIRRRSMRSCRCAPMRPIRAGYGGPEVAAQQRAGYPDIAPADSRCHRERAFEAALAAARGPGLGDRRCRGGRGADRGDRPTFWFGFIDDIVIRIRPTDVGSRIDIRSISRVGVGDIGANAARIRGLSCRPGGSDRRPRLRASLRLGRVHPPALRFSRAQRRSERVARPGAQDLGVVEAFARRLAIGHADRLAFVAIGEIGQARRLVGRRLPSSTLK